MTTQQRMMPPFERSIIQPFSLLSLIIPTSSTHSARYNKRHAELELHDQRQAVLWQARPCHRPSESATCFSAASAAARNNSSYASLSPCAPGFALNSRDRTCYHLTKAAAACPAPMLEFLGCAPSESDEQSTCSSNGSPRPWRCDDSYMIHGTQTTTHDLFHFIYTTSPRTISWKTVRAIEYVFFHHPRATVILHSNTLPAFGRQEGSRGGEEEPNTKGLPRAFALLRGLGYDLSVRPFSVLAVLEATDLSQNHVSAVRAMLPRWRRGANWYSNETNLLRLALLYLHGGVYLDTDVFVIRPFPRALLRNALGYEDVNDQQPNGAVMAFDKGSRFLALALERFVKEYDGEVWGWNGPKLLRRLLEDPTVTPHVRNATAWWGSGDGAGGFAGGGDVIASILPHGIFQPIRWQEASRCFTDSGFAPDLSRTLAIHLNSRKTQKYTAAPMSLCREVLHKWCIFGGC